MGLHRAGFDVTGVDIRPMPRYPFTFHQADALTFPLDYECPTCHGSGDVWAREPDCYHPGKGAECDDCCATGRKPYDFIWASPPCQRYTRAQNAAKNAHAHPDLVAPTREHLVRSGVAWAMENVVGAPLINPVVLCGLAFGLKVKRHRLIESNILLLVPPCPSHDQDYYVIFGHECRNRRHGKPAGRKNRIHIGREAMGIDWMTRGELSESIPPAYSEFIGRQAMQVIRSEAA
jgi:DNA (cytosine-5)-methyltransferase 1